MLLLLFRETIDLLWGQGWEWAGQGVIGLLPPCFLNLQGGLDQDLFTAETLAVTFVILCRSSCISLFLEVGMGSELGNTQHLKDGSGPVQSKGL